MYDPQKVKQFKRVVAAEAQLSYRERPLEGALTVSINFYRPIIKSVSRREMKRREARQALPVVKPDLDNYIKSFLDALHGIYWIDDNQICHIEARKFYSQAPRIEIKVNQITTEDTP
jgi:Holliday junction resolvase RusA-like endonuclease